MEKKQGKDNTIFYSLAVPFLLFLVIFAITKSLGAGVFGLDKYKKFPNDILLDISIMSIALSYLLTSLYYTIKTKQIISWESAFISANSIPVCALIIASPLLLLGFPWIAIALGTKTLAPQLLATYLVPVLVAFFVLKLTNWMFWKILEKRKYMQAVIIAIVAGIIILTPFWVLAAGKKQLNEKKTGHSNFSQPYN